MSELSAATAPGKPAVGGGAALSRRQRSDDADRARLLPLHQRRDSGGAKEGHRASEETVMRGAAPYPRLRASGLPIGAVRRRWLGRDRTRRGSRGSPAHRAPPSSRGMTSWALSMNLDPH